MNKISREHDICIITIDNKPGNSLEKPVFVSPDELDKTIKENECKAIIIKGQGRHFSSGADLEELKKMVAKNSAQEAMGKGKALFQQMISYQIPIIACIEGACLGGGLEVALIADIKIASRKALFAFPETNLGLIPGLGGIQGLSKITGKAKAIEMVLKGDIVDAQTAFDLGIVDQLADAKTTFETGLLLAQNITNQRPLKVINAVMELTRKDDTEETKERETELFCELAKVAVRDM